MASVTTTSNNDDDAPYEVEECRGVLRVFSDGSIIRSPKPSFDIPIHDDGSVEWKDVIFDTTHGLSLRLYKPSARLPEDPPKFPVFYYFHGGGFCIGSRTWPNCQNYCLRLASDLRAIIVAPDYRLAPEHRLPAAIEDGIATIEWLCLQSADPDPWLAESIDFSRVFVSGDSAGGTIVHHTAVQYARSGEDEEVGPIKIRGHVLLMPFFGGAQYTNSEEYCPKEAFLNLELNDRFWRLSLPHGESRDHPVSNPFGPDSPSLEHVRFAPMLVVVGGKDLLRDRAADYTRKLKEWNNPVELVEFEEEQHGFFTLNPRSEPADKLMLVVKRFMAQHGGPE